MIVKLPPFGAQVYFEPILFFFFINVNCNIKDRLFYTLTYKKSKTWSNKNMLMHPYLLDILKILELVNISYYSLSSCVKHFTSHEQSIKNKTVITIIFLYLPLYNFIYMINGSLDVSITYLPLDRVVFIVCITSRTLKIK